MEAYFKSKLGETLKKGYVTGKDFYAEVYERVYNLEVLKVDRGLLTVEVRSYDKVPSGYKKSGTDIELGEITVEIGAKTKNGIIREIVTNKDPNFFLEYKDSIKF